MFKLYVAAFETYKAAVMSSGMLTLFLTAGQRQTCHACMYGLIARDALALCTGAMWLLNIQVQSALPLPLVLLLPLHRPSPTLALTMSVYMGSGTWSQSQPVQCFINAQTRVLCLVQPGFFANFELQVTCFCRCIGQNGPAPAFANGTQEAEEQAEPEEAVSFCLFRQPVQIVACS